MSPISLIDILQTWILLSLILTLFSTFLFIFSADDLDSKTLKKRASLLLSFIFILLGSDLVAIAVMANVVFTYPALMIGIAYIGVFLTERTYLKKQTPW